MTKSEFCTCGSGGHPRKCDIHPERYRLHIAELNVENYLGYLPEEEQEGAAKAMDELLASLRAIIQKSEKDINELTRLVFQTNSNVKSYSLMKFWKKDRETSGGFGGASDYEVWLRKLDHRELSRLIQLHTGAMDALRYRRRYIQNEVERRHLHSSYGKHPAEILFDVSEVP